MATTRRRKSLTLVDQLKSEPSRFEFFQAVRLLETAAAQDHSGQYARAPVAILAQPTKEAIRFKSNNRLAFSGADILSLATEPNGLTSDSGEQQIRWVMDLSFIGLTGAQGVLPYRYSELVLQEIKDKNSALADFFDLFNHRSASLYFQAWHKYRLPVNYERERQSNKGGIDKFTDALYSLAGIGTPELQYRLPFNDEIIAGFSGGLGRNIMSADVLKGMIKHLFQLNVDIEQFKGQWQPLDKEVACRLPGEECLDGVNNQLGVNSIIGSYCYHAQSKFSVIVAPLPYKRFMELAPGTKKLEALRSFIRFSVGIDLEFDISITTAQNQVPPTRLANECDYQPALGWNTHLYAQDEVEIESMKINLSQETESPEEGLKLIKSQ
ncbi:type VI secretion system baseplate subunit TssG [Simiduia litorea]|uniref:type VI secretion system baseplate subunit TssG n=1 Tax=Simiduia litorea TaxID=1435348 RepID=UPI0036F3C227